MQTQTKQQKDYAKLAKLLAWLAYAGVVLFADTMFISMMWTHFPDQPLLRALSIFGSVAMAISAIALPIGLEYWFSPGLQYWAAIGFTVIDLLAQSVNLIVATGLTNATTPAWIVSIADFTPASPMIVALGWALIFLLGDEQKMRHMIREANSETLEKVKQGLNAALQSPSMIAEYESQAREIVSQAAGELRSGIVSGVVSVPHAGGGANVDELMRRLERAESENTRLKAKKPVTQPKE